MLLTFALAAQLAAGSVSYSEARALAGEHKSHLSTDQIGLLHQTQKEAMTAAVPQCMVTVRPTGSLEVSLVLSIGSDGKAVGSWAKQDSAFAKCMEEVLLSRTYISAPVQPFYAAFDFNVGIRPSAP